MNSDDATSLLVHFLRSPNHGNFSSYGYDIYVPNALRTYLEAQGIRHQELEQKIREEMPSFYAAAWELCRRGIIRPGISQYGAQATDDGNAGNGYSVTPFGQRWLDESESDDYVPTEPGRFAEMMEPYRERFGPGFYERSQEAIRCYGAHAYLSCCVMCGAATESIILSAASEKCGEEPVLQQYSGSQGRSRVENMLIGRANEYIKREFKGYTSLMKYWRDASAHGMQSGIKENEAYTSIALLLRFASFMSDNWDQMTG